MEQSIFHEGVEIPDSLPRGRHKLEREVILASQRGRLISAFVELAAEHGYDNVTIIDIVSRAGTSKRTFYEHFEDKEDCLLQTFDTLRNLLLAAIVGEAGPVDDPVERIRVGVRAYIATLAELPDFARLFLSESMAAGVTLADRWIEAVDALAATICGWREESRARNPEVPELSSLRARIVLTGINEVICMTAHREGIEAVEGISEELVEDVIALLLAA